jgi:Flp pilus assembly pilin Flp
VTAIAAVSSASCAGQADYRVEAAAKWRKFSKLNASASLLALALGSNANCPSHSIQHLKRLNDQKISAGTAVQRLLTQFLRAESATTAIEYALILAGVSVLIVAILHEFGGALMGTFLRVASGLDHTQVIVIEDP